MASLATAVAFGLALAVMPADAREQREGRGRGGQAPAGPARVVAPIDLTGAWISVVTEDWRWRMVTPAKGDYTSVPINAAGRKMADTWNPATDEANGTQCRAYGAAAVLRLPGRVRFSWENDTTLKLDMEAGSQTRLLRFGNVPAPTGGYAGWQGHSAASWIYPVTAGATGGRLLVTTTAMRPGYLRKNGVPYGANAVMTEYFERFVDKQDGIIYLVLTTVIEDPQYLSRSYVTSTHFKKLADGSPWEPTPCSAR